MADPTSTTTAEANPPLITIAQATHKIQTVLLDSHQCSQKQLLSVASLLSQPDYADVVTERSIAKICGYPLCPNSLPSERPRKGKYRISLSEHRVYDLQESYQFCSDECLVNSKLFAGTLAEERRDGMSGVKILDALEAFEGRSKVVNDREKKKEAEEIFRDLEVGIGDLGFSKLEIREKSDVKKGGVLPLEEWIGPSNAIEGYVPRDRNQGMKSKVKAKPRRHEDDDCGEIKNGIEFTSEIFLGDPLEGSSSKCKEKQDEQTLVSSLKQKSVKGRKHSVKWADQEEAKPTSMTNELKEDDESSARIAYAEACATALLEASEAISSGEFEDEDAVSKAGLVILPSPYDDGEDESKTNEDDLQFSRNVMKWPKKPVLLDDDVFDVEDLWHDTMPPEDFSLTLSTFATMWMSLFEWVTCSSLAYIYGQDETSQEEFSNVNGREYPHKISMNGGRSLEIKQTLAGCISRALPQLVSGLSIPTPVSNIEKAMSRLLDTMSFVDPLPPFKSKEWQVIVLLFVESLSMFRIPVLAKHMNGKKKLQHKILNAAHVIVDEYETMKDLMNPLGRYEVYLGRPWRRYSRTMVMGSYIGEEVSPKGWHAWSESSPLDSVELVEYNNRGPGSRTSERVAWAHYNATKEEAVKFAVGNLIGGWWLNATTYPFYFGL